jgi:serralysin
MAFQLTTAEPNQASFILYKPTSGTPISSSQGLSATFEIYSYGGSGGDGISFSLIDGSLPDSVIKAGAFGGSLGYAQNALLGTPGIPGGYVGIGFDEFGNFTNASDDRAISPGSPIPAGTAARNGGPGNVPDSISIRGSAATNYKFIDNGVPAPLPVSLDGATREASRRKAQVDISPTGILTVQIDLNGDNDFNDAGEKPVDGLNLIAVGNGALPSTFKFGFAASTGQFTNVHEIDNFSVRTFGGVPIAGSFDQSSTGSSGNDVLQGSSGNDTITGGAGKDTITGQAGNDVIVGGVDADAQTGGTGADRFVFSGNSKALALKDSTLRALDRITDCSFFEGDRFQLDFDNNLNTSERPKGLFNAGKLKGSLQKAAQNAYADKDQKKKGKQVLKADEAVFFRLGSRTYLSVNDNKKSFSAQNDLLVDVTGIQFKPKDANKGSLAVANYFS